MAVTQEVERDRDVRNEAEEQDRLAQLQLQIRLRCQFGYSAPAISARCSAGILVLEGHVDSFHQKQTAQEFARRIPGVKSVVNRLVVDPSRVSSRVHETFCTTADHICD